MKDDYKVARLGSIVYMYLALIFNAESIYGGS